MIVCIGLYREYEILKGVQFRSIVCPRLARLGDLRGIQWAIENNFTLSTDVMSHAAVNGTQQTLQWLRSIGCPWDVTTCSRVARNGRLDILKWFNFLV